MIRRVDSDIPGFKSLEFGPGLNMLLAEKSAGATDKHTRNGAGKSSLLEIVHFLLGSSCKKDSIFRRDELRDATFGLELDLAGNVARVERSGQRPARVAVDGDASGWPVLPAVKHGLAELSNTDWKVVLGRLMFGVAPDEGTWSPSFRSLLSYFVRRESEGGMAEPMRAHKEQRLADQQVSISFLLGLDWRLAREWQLVREREASLKQLKKSMKDGAFGVVVGKASTLKSELIVAEDRVRRLRSALTSFRVLEHYDALVREADELQGRLNQLGDDDFIDSRYISELEKVALEEPEPVASDLEALFNEAGVVLPSLVQRRFDEALEFHESIVKNRKGYLAGERREAERRLADRATEKRRVDTRLAEVMKVLEAAGALEQFVAMQSELGKAESATEVLRLRHDDAQKLESGQLHLQVDRARLEERLRLEYAEQESAISEAVLTFRDISAQLYGESKAGRLTITPGANGPEFEAHLPSEKSKGVNNMRIFCYDMMLMVLSLKRGRSPGFLVHDSHLFDGVDERQVGKALAVGAALAEEHGFQYIVTMNTDSVPQELPAGFNLESSVLPVRLSDRSQDGGLFGFRFQ